jgi:hypothetical protein
MEKVHENHMKIFKDGSLKEDRVGYAVITPESTITERTIVIGIPFSV